MFSEIQWKIFGLTQQDGKGLKQTADILKLDAGYVAQALKDMRRDEPGLFLSNYDGRSALHSGDRPKMRQYHNDLDDQIEHKY